MSRLAARPGASDRRPLQRSPAGSRQHRSRAPAPTSAVSSSGCRARCRGSPARRQAVRDRRRSAATGGIGERRDDTDTFGDVVQGKAKHQEGAKPRNAGRERGADRQPFSQIMQADAEGNVGGEREPGRRAVAASDRRTGPGTPRAAMSPTITTPWNEAAALHGELQRFLHRSRRPGRRAAPRSARGRS